MHKLYYVLYIMSDIGNTADMTAPPLNSWQVKLTWQVIYWGSVH